MALASGPDAEDVLRAVARVFAWRAASFATHARDSALIADALGGGRQAWALVEEMADDLLSGVRRG